MKLTILISLLFITGCTSLQTVSLTSIPAQRSKAVSAEVSKTIFLGFNFDNDFVDQMENQLKSQCPNGMVSGILTKDEVVDYFLMIVWKRRVTATGYCVKSSTASLPNNSHRPASINESDSGEPL